MLRPHRGDRIMSGPRLRRQDRKANREVLPLYRGLKESRGEVDFVAIPIDHAGTNLMEEA
jgi:alpha-amylase/alpha-mannosidase (GH57 family)